MSEKVHYPPEKIRTCFMQNKLDHRVSIWFIKLLPWLILWKVQECIELDIENELNFKSIHNNTVCELILIFWSFLKECFLAWPWKILTRNWIWNSCLFGKGSKTSTFNLLIYLSKCEIWFNYEFARQSPVYVSEIAPKNLRGGFAAALQVS